MMMRCGADLVPLKGTRMRTRRVDRQRTPVHLIIASLGAASIAFLGAFEPNLTLRFGPFIAVGVLLFSNFHRFRIGRTEWLLAAFLGWCMASQFWSSRPDSFSVHFTALLASAAIFIGIRSAIRWGHGVIVVSYGYALGVIVGIIRTSSDFASPEAVRDIAGRVAQVGDLNVNYVAYGAVAATLALVLIYQQRRKVAGKLFKLCTIALIVVLGAGGIATQTRGAQIALALLFLWLIVSRFTRPIKTVAIGAVAVAIAISAGWVDSFLSLFDYGTRSLSGLSGRVEMWAVARSIWGEALFEGSGFGVVRGSTNYSLPAHNTILELGASIGAVGVLLFFGFAVCTMTDRTGALDVRDRRFRLGAIIVTMAPIVLSGTWEFSASAWIALAVLSQPLARDGEIDTGRPTSSDSLEQKFAARR